MQLDNPLDPISPLNPANPLSPLNPAWQQDEETTVEQPVVEHRAPTKGETLAGIAVILAIFAGWAIGCWITERKK